MNKLINGLIILGVLFALPSCKSDSSESPSEQVVQFQKLANTWSLTSVTLDDNPVTGYENFSLIISGDASAESYNYNVSGRPELSPWPASGTWQFGTNVSTQIIRDADTVDEIGITYSYIDNTLTAEFDFSGEGYAGGRREGVSGHWVFVFGL